MLFIFNDALGDNEVISNQRLQHQSAFTNGSPDVLNEIFKEIRSSTASPADNNRIQIPDKKTKEIVHSKQR